MKFCMNCIVVLFALLPIIACGKETPEKEVIRPIRAIQVSDPNELTKRWFPGQAKATREVDLSFRVAGPLITRPVNVGDDIRSGQEMARIDPRDYEVALRDAKGRLERAEAALERAEADYERVLRIQKKDAGAVSQSMVDRNKQQVESRRAEIRSLQAAVDAAQDRLGYTYLNAPFDGTVTSTYVENHEDVKAKQPIIRLIDHSQIEMVVNIPEDIISYADYLKAAGKVLYAKFDSFPDRDIEAQIKEIGKEASKTTRTYPVTLLMDQPEEIKILPGMAGKAASRINPMQDKGGQTIVIPETAVFSPTDDGKTYVWVVDETTQKVSRREVVAGELLNNGIAVSEGLKPEEWIATAGVHYLKEGQTVRILSPAAAEVTK